MVTLFLLNFVSLNVLKGDVYDHTSIVVCYFLLKKLLKCELFQCH